MDDKELLTLLNLIFKQLSNYMVYFHTYHPEYLNKFEFDRLYEQNKRAFEMIEKRLVTGKD